MHLTVFSNKAYTGVFQKPPKFTFSGRSSFDDPALPEEAFFGKQHAQLLGLGLSFLTQRQFIKANQKLTQSLEFLDTDKQPRKSAHVLYNLAINDLMDGKYNSADQRLTRSLAILNQYEPQQKLMQAKVNLMQGWLYHNWPQKNHLAKRHFEKALRLLQRIRNKGQNATHERYQLPLGDVYLGLGLVAFDQGQSRRCKTYLSEALALKLQTQKPDIPGILNLYFLLAVLEQDKPKGPRQGTWSYQTQKLRTEGPLTNWPGLLYLTSGVAYWLKQGHRATPTEKAASHGVLKQYSKYCELMGSTDEAKKIHTMLVGESWGKSGL